MYTSDAPAAYWRDQLYLWGPKVLLAVLILVVTHFIAKTVQWAVARGIDKVPVLKRHPQAGGESVGIELGRLAYWLVWLVGLIAALQPLGLSGVLTPVTSLTNEVFAFLPRLLGAGLFFFAGLILARIVRHVIEAALGALNIERLLGRAGSASANRRSRSTKRECHRRRGSGSWVDSKGGRNHRVGDDHHLRRHRRAADPADFGDLRSGNGDAQQHCAGDPPRARRAGVAGDRLPDRPLGENPGRNGASEPRLRRQRSSARNHAGELQSVAGVGAIAMTAILLAAAIEAARQLGGDSVAVLLFQITELGGKVIFGTVIIVAGLFLARMLAALVGSSTGDAGYAQTIVKYAIIALFTAIGLTFMGLADQIVMLAFGLILGSAAVATALAFGLGGRDAAARILGQWAEDQRRRRGSRRRGFARRRPSPTTTPLPPLV